MDIFSFIGNLFSPAAKLVDNLHTSEEEKQTHLDLTAEFIQVEKEKSVAAEKITAGGVIDAAVFFRFCAKTLGQGAGCIIGGVRSLAIDDNDQIIGILREGLGQFLAVTAEIQVRRQHILGIGIDAGILRKVHSRAQAHQHRGDNHRPRETNDGARPSGQAFAVSLGKSINHAEAPWERRRL